MSSRMDIRGLRILEQLGSIMSSIWNLLLYVALSVVMFFAPAKLNIYMVGGLIVADIITALLALFMVEKKKSPSLRAAFASFYEKWTSRRAFDSVPKFIYYSILVLLNYAIGHIIEEPLKMCNLATGIIAYIEVRSIIENGDKACGTNIWEAISNYLGKFLPSQKHTDE